MKAFLGTGLLGSGFVQAMLQKGETVHVWNRTTYKAKALEQYGATAFDEAADAVAGADIIHLTLKDDATVDEVLENSSRGLKQGATIIDHTTTSAQGAIKRTAYWKSKGLTYLHAPVFMNPANALAGTGVMLVSGDQSVIDKLQHELSRMTGKLLNFGEEVGKTAGLKLIGNSFLIALTGGLSDALSLAKAHRIAAEEVLHLFENWNPGAGVPARLQRMMEANFDQPSWELGMARKDAGLMMDAAQEGNRALMMVSAVAVMMDEWIAKGQSNKDWTVIVKDNL